jgi:hypothetical protein
MCVYFNLLTYSEVANFLCLSLCLCTLLTICKSPAINEVVRLLGDLLYLLPRTDELNIGRYCLQALAVYPADRQLLAKERSATFLGKFMKELLAPVLPRYTDFAPALEIPIPTAIIDDRKVRQLHH